MVPSTATEKISGDTTGDRSRDPPTGSAVPLPLRYRAYITERVYTMAGEILDYATFGTGDDMITAHTLADLQGGSNMTRTICV
jgi:hypothetical protein